MKKPSTMIVFLVLMFILSGCAEKRTSYFFIGKPINYTPDKEYEYTKYLSFSTYPISSYKNEVVRNINFEKSNKTKKIEILEKKVKVLYEGKEYYLNVHPIRKDRLVNDNKVRMREEFDLYLGKVKINDNQIIDIPPLRFKKYIEIEEYIPILEDFNKDSKKTIYLGPLEDYRKKK